MPMRLQVKLLRVLQENQIRPAGDAAAVAVNVRVISATHRDLHQLMVGGQFREDLYYRLNVVHIEMPSLARRREDIPLLVAHFLERIAKESGQRQDLRAGGGGAARHRRMARQRAPALQRGAAERGAVARRDHHRRTRAAVARRQHRRGCPHSTRRATNSRATTCRRSCRSPPATSARRRGSRSATAPTSTSCCRATSCCRTTSRSLRRRIAP